MNELEPYFDQTSGDGHARTRTCSANHGNEVQVSKGTISENSINHGNYGHGLGEKASLRSDFYKSHVVELKNNTRDT